MINYVEKLQGLRFNFRPEEIIDYEALVSLAGSIMTGNEFDTYKEELFHTIQILVLVYGLDEQVSATQNKLDINNFDVHNLDHWKQLIVMLYNDMVASSDFKVSDNTRAAYYNVLNILLNTPIENTVAPQMPEPTEEKREGMFIDNSPYEFVEPDESYSFVQEAKQQHNEPLPLCNPDEAENCNACVAPSIIKTSDDNLNDFSEEYLRDYVINNKLIPYACDICGMNEWQGKHLSLKLAYRNKNSKDKNLNNLRFLCPNCYSQVGKE